MDTALCSRFIAAVHFGEPDLEVRHICNVYHFVFGWLPEGDQKRLAALSGQGLNEFVYNWQADLPTPGLDDVGERLCELVGKYQDVVMPTAELLAAASERNLNLPHCWTWLLARLPLSQSLADAIKQMNEDERFAFCCGTRDEDGDAIKHLDEKFPHAHIQQATDRLDNLYMEGENCYFGMED
jgi:hypothetical protein